MSKTQILIGTFSFFFLINILTFFVRGWDKWQAKKQKWRISEKTLLTLSLCGGRIGAILAIEFFRHKTIKGSFLWRFYLAGGIWIVFLIGLLYFLG